MSYRPRIRRDMRPIYMENYMLYMGIPFTKESSEITAIFLLYCEFLHADLKHRPEFYLKDYSLKDNKIIVTIEE